MRRNSLIRWFLLYLSNRKSRLEKQFQFGSPNTSTNSSPDEWLRTSSTRSYKKYMEIWKDVPGWEHSHEVSSLGRIRSKDRKITYCNGRVNFSRWKILDCYLVNGYFAFRTKRNGQNFYVHRLVAAMFHWLDLDDPKQFSCHKNDIKTDNRETNLFVWSAKENSRDMSEKGRGRKGVIPILQIHSNGTILKKWKNMQEASIKLSIARSSINECCKWTKNSAGGYIWQFFDR